MSSKQVGAAVLGIALGALSGGVAGFAMGVPLFGAGVGSAAAFWAGAGIAAALAAVPLLIGAMLAKDLPGAGTVATSSIDDIQLSTFTRSGRIPVVYGFRRVGVNVIHLGKTEYKDVTVASTGRNESHLFADLLCGVAEGRCREAIALYLQDTPLPVGTWRFQPGTDGDVAIPELAETVPEGRNLRYPNTAKVFISGDLGAVSNIPAISMDLRGIYPEVIREFAYPAGFTPARATLDGPTNTLVIFPKPGTAAEPRGIITYNVPFENAPPVVRYTQPPTGVTGNISRAFYFGKVNALVMQDPVDARLWHFGRPGLERASTEWSVRDFGPAFHGTLLAASRDDRTCRIFTLHAALDGTLYQNTVSILTFDHEQMVFPSGGFTNIVKTHFAVEENAWYMLVTGGGPARVMKFARTTMQWTVVAEMETTDVVDMIKIGIMLYVFYESSATEVNTASGGVTTGIPLTDFMSEDDAEALGDGLRCLALAVSRHRYSGIATWESEDGSVWRITVFHEPRAEGDTFPSPSPFRRYVFSKASSGTYIQKPGMPENPPIERVVWCTTGPISAETPLEDVIASGADYRTAREDAVVPSDLTPDGDVSATYQSLVGAGTAWQALATRDDDTSYVRMRPGDSVEVSLTDVADPGVHTDHTVRIRFRFAPGTIIGPPVWPHTMFLQFALYQGGTLLAASPFYGTRAPNVAGVWYEKLLTLTTAQAEAITDYTDLRVRITASGVWSGLSDYIDVTWCHASVGNGAVVAIGSGLRAISYYPVHNNAQEHRRVVFYRDRGDGVLEWFFTVRGEINRCAARDFNTTFVTKYEGSAIAVSSTTTQLTDDPPTNLDAFDACRGSAISLPAYNAYVLDYDGAGLVTHTNVSGTFPTPITAKIQGPDWNMRLWTILTPSQIDLGDSATATGTPHPPYLLEGRLIGRGWGEPTTISEIIAMLEDDGHPTGGESIPYESHNGPYDITGLLYAKARFNPGAVSGGIYIVTGYGPGAYPPGFNSIPFPPDAPLKQLRLDTEPRPAWVYNTAAFLNEAGVPGAMMDFYTHGSPPETCGSGEMTRDLIGQNAAGDTIVVAHAVEVASWEAIRTVLVRDPKSKYVEMSVGPNGMRHDWFEGRTTPAACRMDMLLNRRYGYSVPVSGIDVAAHLSLHGWSLTKIHVDGETIRRFIWNAVLTDAMSLSDLDERLLTPAAARGVSSDGRRSVVFDVPGVEPVMEFDGSLIEAGSFQAIPGSERTGPNRVLARFYNAADQRDDTAEIDDQDDQDATGEVREREIAIECATDYRRVFYLAYIAMERRGNGAMAISFAAPAFVRMILDVGDPILVSHPLGLWRRRSFRIVSLEDTAEKVQIEAEEITVYSMDQRGLVGLRANLGGITGTHQGSSTANSLSRDRSLERFAGVAMSPMRVVAAMRDDGGTLLLGNRPPASQEILGLRAKLVNAATSRVFDELAVTEARSVSIVDDVLESDGTYQITGLIDVPERLTLPSDGYLCKRLTADPAITIQRVSITQMVGGGKNDGWSGQVEFARVDPLAADVLADTAAPAAVYVVTESDHPSSGEPVAYDGSGSSPRLWADPGAWTDITEVFPAGGSSPVLSKYMDYLVVGWDGNWLPNCIAIEFDTPSPRNQALVVEYSCEPDDRLPLPNWKPLALLDATNGFTRSGRMHFEIPPDWVQTAAWDQHGNTTGGPGGDRTKRFWIRIQRRDRAGAGGTINGLTIENLPYIVVVPRAPETVRLPQETQGQSTEFRFLGRSRFRDDDVTRCPGVAVVSTGSRWAIKPPTDLELFEPLDQAAELSHGDFVTSVIDVDYVFGWAYVSVSHGFGHGSFADTIAGVAVDPHLNGVHVTVRRQSDGLTLSEQVVPYPIDRWIYEWVDRRSHGNVPVAIEFRQYDDRGYYSDAVAIGLGTVTYGTPPLGEEPVQSVADVAVSSDNYACTLVGQDGASQVFVVKHNLNSVNLIANIYAINSPKEVVAAKIEYTDANTITVTFTPAPGTGVDHRLVIDR